MREKQIGGPVVTVIIVVVVLLVVGAGYYFMNKDSIGKAGEPVKYGKPGERMPGSDPKIGPFPFDPKGNSSKLPAGSPIPGAPPSGQSSGGQ